MRKAGMLMVTALAASLLAGCGYKASDKKEEVTITVFAAKSLNQVMEELIAEFQKTHENVNVQGICRCNQWQKYIIRMFFCWPLPVLIG